jgi:CBS-domain-containing membrane protein
MNPQSPLPTRHLDAGTTLVQAQPWQTHPVSLDSPALDVMTDLSKVKAATTLPTTGVQEAERQMITLGVRMLFVVSAMPAVEGLVTSADLHGDRVLRVVQQRGVRYDELTVADVMTALPALEAIDFDRIKGARVSNVVATLQRHGRHHLLVVEAAADGAPRVRGVVSRSQVERQLGRVIEMVEVAESFAEIGQAIR